MSFWQLHGPPRSNLQTEIWLPQSLAQVLPHLTSFGPWASPYGTNVQITMTVHNYKTRWVHKTLNGINPSSGFRDLLSAKSGPNLTSFWSMGKPIWGKCANDHDSAQLYTCTGLDNSIELRTEKIRQAVTEIWIPEIWQLPAWPPTLGLGR